MKRLVWVCLLFSGCLYHPVPMDQVIRRTEWVPVTCHGYKRVEITSSWKEGRMEYEYKCSNDQPYGTYLRMEEVK